MGRKWSSQNGSLCGKGMTVLDLEPAQSYTATVTTVSNSLKVQSAPATCRTESTGEWRVPETNLALKTCHGVFVC